MNFPRIMKNVKRLAHFGNDVWLIKSTNSPKIIPKILFHTIEWGPWFEIRHCIRKFHDIRRLNRMCWAIVRHHLPHMRFPLRIIHIVHHPVMVFDHHADLQLAIDSIWCHHLVNSDTFTLQLIEVSHFIFFFLIISSFLLQSQVTIVYTISNDVTTELTEYEASLLRYNAGPAFESNFITTKWWLW